MFHRLLLPVDLSERHDEALRTAGERCSRSGGIVRLLHVIELIPNESVEEERPFYDQLEQAARDHLDKLGRRLEEMQIEREIDVRLGHRLEQIAACAGEMKADLLILSR